MKKLSSLSILFLMVTFMISCSKENINTQETFSPIDPSSLPVKVRLISDWVSLSMVETRTRSEVHLQGRYQFDQATIYDKNYHMELLYAKIPSSRSGEVKRVPMKLLIESITGVKMIIGFKFQTDDNGFFLTINNTDPAADCPDPSDFSDFKYRYIVIPRSEYDSLNINWDDYAEVSHALHL